MKSFVIKKESIIYFIIIPFVMAGLIVFAKSSQEAAKNAVNLCISAVIPSLFPFFVCSRLLISSPLSYKLSQLLSPVMRPLFNLSGPASLPFLLGTISGYPVGAKTACSLYESGSLSKDEAERVLAFSNNASPVFIAGTIGVIFYGNFQAGCLLYLTHIIAAIISGIILGIKSPKTTKKAATGKKSRAKAFSDLVSEAVSESVLSVLNVCGFIIFFAVLTNEINLILSPIFGEGSAFSAIMAGIFEITCGNTAISLLNIPLSFRLALSSVFLGFGGICVCFQVLSICAPNGLSLKYYIKGKALQGLIAGLLTPIIMKFFPIANKAFAGNNIQNIISYGKIALITITYTAICILFMGFIAYTARLFKTK